LETFIIQFEELRYFTNGFFSGTLEIVIFCRTSVTYKKKHHD